MGWRDQTWCLGNTVLEPGRGGIGRVARMTAKSMAEEGVRAEALSFLDAQPHHIGNIRTKAAKGSRLKYIGLCYQAERQCDTFLYDSVGMARAHPRLPGWRKPYGVWIHGLEVWQGLHPDRERALRKADFVLANSRHTLDRFDGAHRPLENVHVVPLATEHDTVPHQASFDGRPTVLMVGRLDKEQMRKGHDDVIRCWPDVVSAVPDATLLIAGGGDGLGLVKEAAARSPDSASIHVLGFVPDHQLTHLWQRAHVFALPSQQEGFGIVYAEAMRHGVPVIASIHDAGQEVNLDGQTGYNVDLTRREELPSRLIHLLRETRQAQRLGRAGHQRWLNHYRFSAFQTRLARTLDQCA
ncbi:MAG: glycosyltransferase family 4 protein [Pseudomonadota bacterium]